MGVAEAAVWIAAAGLANSVVQSSSSQRQAQHANDTAQHQAQAEIAERNRNAAERTAALTAEAERERALAISNQEAQNVRVNALASEAAANEKAIAQNISSRSAEEALITQKEADREAARIKDLQATTQSRQIAALAGGGVAVGDESGTAGALLLDTKSRADKDIGSLKDAVASKVNLLQKTGSFALDQGDVSAKNILASAAHNTTTSLENIKNAGDSLVANAKIQGASELNMTNLQNLMTLGSAAQFSDRVAQLRSDANAKMWSSLLGSNMWSTTNLNTLLS